MVRVLFRAGLGVSIAQMERGMGIAARKRERQQHDEATQEQGSLHGKGTELRKVSERLNSRIAQSRFKVKAGPRISAAAGARAGHDGR